MTITNLGTLENWLWEAACKIRGEVDAPKYKDFILPLIFIKRLSDVYEDEIQRHAEEFGDKEIAEQIVAEDQDLVRVYVPKDARWEYLSRLSTNIGEALTDAVRELSRKNEELSGVIDIVDFNATTAGQRIITDEQLKALIQVLNKYRLGLNDVEPDIMGRAYEYLISKFSTVTVNSAGEHFTPRHVGMLMAKILDPQQGMTVYDPCAGSSGLLIKCQLHFNDKHGKKSGIRPLHFFGQEIEPTTYAVSRMNLFLHDMGESEIRLGNSMRRPAFTESDTSLMKYDRVTANPMWNQDFEQTIYETDPYGRFQFGYPPSNTADWGWIQHMYHSLKDDGKLAVVLDTGCVSRGSGNAGKNRERDIRKEFVERDLVETVILLPENMFYNTTAPGVILVINNTKSHSEEVLLINASKHFEKGRPKNEMTLEQIDEVVAPYLKWEEIEGLSKVVKKEEVIQNDYSLSPSRYVQQNGVDETLPLEDALVLVKEAEEERELADVKLKSTLSSLGL